MEKSRPKPGIGVLIIKDSEWILMGKRKDCDMYGMPGGYLEMFEEFEEAASREVKEEVNLDIPPENMKLVCIFNAVEKSRDYHNVAIVLACKYIEGQEVATMEPDKCWGWEWWKLSDLERRMDEIFWPNLQLIREFKKEISQESLSILLNK